MRRGSAGPAMMHLNDVAEPERQKYREMWDVPQYADHSPGLESVDRFIEMVKPAPGASIIDIGCGKGVAGEELGKRGFKVNYLDLVNFTDLPIIETPLWQDWACGRIWDHGYCCDVLEHVPPEYSMLCVARIIACCGTSFMQIAFEPDSFGAVIGKNLHLTVQPFTWWRDRIASIGKLVEARDLCGRGIFVVGEDK